jgi:hypothetical protein
MVCLETDIGASPPLPLLGCWWGSGAIAFGAGVVWHEVEDVGTNPDDSGFPGDSYEGLRGRGLGRGAGAGGGVWRGESVPLSASTTDFSMASLGAGGEDSEKALCIGEEPLESVQTKDKHNRTSSIDLKL